MQPGQAEALRFEHELVLLLHLARRLAQDRGSTELAVQAAGTVVLDQQAELIAVLQDPMLKVAVDDLAGAAGRAGVGEEQSLLAAQRVPHLFGDRGHIELAHAGGDRRQRGVHGLRPERPR